MISKKVNNVEETITRIIVNSQKSRIKVVN